MFSAFSTALSGLNAMTNAIDVVGNNLANLNTTGYKNTSVSFKELVSQALGGSASSQVGLGTSRPDSTRQFLQGATQTTGGQYDAAISGSGFFVVKDTGNQEVYSRDGNFQLDKNGYLVTSGGARVQGWSASNGVLNTNGATGDIQAPIGAALQPVATTQFSLTANLNSSSTPVIPMSANGSTSGPATITAGTNDTLNLNINGVPRTFTLSPAPADANMTAVAADLQAQFAATPGIGATAGVDASGRLLVTSTSSAGNAGVEVLAGNANAVVGLSTTSHAVTATNTYSSGIIQPVDSLGNIVPLTLSFTKQTTNGSWNYSVSSTASQGVVSGGSGTVQFNNLGQMTGIKSATVSADGKSDTITINNLNDGAAPLTMSYNFFNTDGSPKLTQFSEASAASANSQDGQVAATFTDVSLGDNGRVLAKYSSGAQLVAGQLAVASIRNPQSLFGVSDNNYSVGADTATPTIGTSGTGGRGTITGGALESSTVDIASQFSNLLTFQRSYQANSRVITVSDQISQETVNLIK